MNYSYKKGSSATIRGASDKIKILQSVFSSRNLNKTMENKLLINIDEWSF